MMQAHLQPEPTAARRETLWIAVTLALLSGLVLGQLGAFVFERHPVASVGSDPNPKALAAARGFYAGIDRVLATGDEAAGVGITLGFVDHLPGAEMERGWPETVAWLLELRSTWPRLQYRVAELEPRGHMVVVRLRVDPGEPAAISGLPLATSPSFAVTEYLETERGAVSARWAAALPLPLITGHLQYVIAWGTTAYALPTISRVVLDPGNTTQLQADQPLLVWVVAGSVRFSRDTADLGGTRILADRPAGAGDARVLDGGGEFAIRNDADARSELWVFSTRTSLRGKSAPPDSIEPASLVFMPLEWPSDAGQTSTLAVERLLLPAGGAVGLHQVGLVQEIVVLDGAIEVTASDGRALECCIAETARPFDGSVILSMGQGAAAKGATQLEFQAAGGQSATVLIFSIDPVTGDSTQTSPVAGS